MIPLKSIFHSSRTREYNHESTGALLQLPRKNLVFISYHCIYDTNPLFLIWIMPYDKFQVIWQQLGKAAGNLSR